MNTIPKLVNRKWWWITLLVIIGVGVLARLGIWQLDRMQQKRDYNTLMAERWRQEPFDLNVDALPTDLSELEYRRIAAQGSFDYANQLLLKNQVFGNTNGFVVLTPLVLGEGRAVLVARGWIPSDKGAVENWSQFVEPAAAPVLGRIRMPDEHIAEGPGAVTSPQVEWHRVDLPAIQQQMPYTLEPALIEQLPEENRAYDKLPIRQEPTPLDEGNHLSYAVQWFMFALILGIGYIFFVRWQEMRASRPQEPYEDVMPMQDQEQMTNNIDPAPNAGHSV
jgi:surfeit locus 1 family protein